MRLLMAAKSISSPDHNKWFGIHTNTSGFQIGMCIIQEERPVAYFYCKLTMSQQNYTTLEKEILSIKATLEEFYNSVVVAKLSGV